MLAEGGGAVFERDWDDDSDYKSAVRRTRITMVFAAFVALGVIVALVVAVLGVLLVVGWVELRSP